MSSLILFPTNQYTATSKSPEEIQKLLLPDTEPTSSRILHILTKGHSLQHYYAYKNFVECYTDTLPAICASAPQAQGDNQITIIQSLEMLVNECLGEDIQKGNGSSINNLISIRIRPILMSNELESIFNMLIQCLNNWSCSMSLSQSILSLLEKILRLSIDENQGNNTNLLKKLQKTVVELGKGNQPVISRVNAGRLISILPQFLNGTIKGEMVEILKKIHSDPEIQAKKVWVGEIFPKMLNYSQLQFIELHLQEKIYKSIYDENEEVGVLALEVILKNCTKFSILQQSSRIIKVFIDSLTSKSQKIVLMVTSMMGEVYQKLRNIIMTNQQSLFKFWKSVIQLSMSKDQRIIDNLIYNLPGLLHLTYQYYDVSPICDIYFQLFNDSENVLSLTNYLSQMANMFPNKKQLFKTIIYTMFAEILEDGQDAVEQSFIILNSILSQIPSIKFIFYEWIEQPTNTLSPLIIKNALSLNKECKQTQVVSCPVLETKFTQYLCDYLVLLLVKKNVVWLKTYLTTLLQIYIHFNGQICQQQLLPKLYNAIKMKASNTPIIIKIIVGILAKQLGNIGLMNNYVNKINLQLCKSSKGFERQAAMLFFYEASFSFSLETFQEYKLGDKFLNLHNDRIFKIKPHLEEKIEYSIILSKLTKNQDSQIINIISQIQFTEKQSAREEIMKVSRQLKEKEKERILQSSKRISNIVRKQTKEIKKQQNKKFIQTKSKAKIIIKQVKKKSLLKTEASVVNIKKNA